jgi:hypothetical protein
VDVVLLPNAANVIFSALPYRNHVNIWGFTGVKGLCVVRHHQSVTEIGKGVVVQLLIAKRPCNAIARPDKYLTDYIMIAIEYWLHNLNAVSRRF